MRDMTEGRASKLILAFTLPMFVGNLFQQLYNMVDSAVVGRFVGPNALAAVGTSFPIIFVLISLVFGLTMGSGVIVSQFFGAKQYEQVRRAVSTALTFLLVGSLLVSVIGLLLSRPLLTLLRVPAEIIEDSATYMRIFFSGLIFMFAYNSFAGILRSLGDSKTPLYFLIVATVVNIVLDVYFVARLGWGVAGVAWATLIAQATSAVLCLIYTQKKVPLLRFKRTDWVFDVEIFKTMIRLGIPSSLQQTVVSMSMMAVQGLVNSFGSVTMAAFTAAGRIDSLNMMPLQSFSMALSTYVGQNVGANRLERVSEGLRATLKMVFVSCLLVSLIVFMFGPQLIQIFIDGSETEVIRQGVDYMRTVSIFYICFGVLMVMGGLLRGAGDAVFPMIASITSLLIRVASAYWLASLPGLGYRGIWWAIPIGWTVGATIPITRYLTGGWKAKAVVRQLAS
ncbi:MAG: MATE family efflux transporter [Bacillota bacterium]|jgi:putative MATE family efflux protein